MAVSAKIFVLVIPSLLYAGGALAQQTPAPSDRCEGTLCDLYYSGRGKSADTTTAKPAPAPVPGVPAGATPVMAPSGTAQLSDSTLKRWFGGWSDSSAHPPPPPSEPATANNDYMHLGSGGLLGGKQERCTGTLCDAFYGSSPAEPTTPAAPDQRQAAAQPAGGSASPEEPAIAYRHIPHESEVKKCSSPASDPWRCFRK